MLRTPPVLKPGDKVALIAPSSHQKPGDENLVREGVHVLQSWGLEVVYSPNPDRRYFYLAGKDHDRADEFLRVLADPDIRAVFMTRGGYGAARFLNRLSPLSPDLAGLPKIVVGFSDVTTLLLHLQNHGQMVVYHGPHMASRQFLQTPDSAANRESLRHWLFDPHHRPKMAVDMLRPGIARGPLMGGCLSMLCTSIGTAHEPNTDGCILFIEDVDEKPYAIDRMLVHLRNAGKLSALSGLVFGDMAGCQPDRLQRVIIDLFQDVDYPVAWNLPAGHGPLNMTLALGKTVELNGTEGRMSYC